MLKQQKASNLLIRYVNDPLKSPKEQKDKDMTKQFLYTQRDKAFK